MKFLETSEGIVPERVGIIAQAIARDYTYALEMQGDTRAMFIREAYDKYISALNDFSAEEMKVVKNLLRSNDFIREEYENNPISSYVPKEEMREVKKNIEKLFDSREFNW